MKHCLAQFNYNVSAVAHTHSHISASCTFRYTVLGGTDTNKYVGKSIHHDVCQALICEVDPNCHAVGSFDFLNGEHAADYHAFNSFESMMELKKLISGCTIFKEPGAAQQLVNMGIMSMPALNTKFVAMQVDIIKLIKHLNDWRG